MKVKDESVVEMAVAILLSGAAIDAADERIRALVIFCKEQTNNGEVPDHIDERSADYIAARQAVMAFYNQV